MKETNHGLILADTILLAASYYPTIRRNKTCQDLNCTQSWIGGDILCSLNSGRQKVGHRYPKFFLHLVRPTLTDNICIHYQKGSGRLLDIAQFLGKDNILLCHAE